MTETTATAIEAAFSYRGYVTITLHDGTERSAYVSNRNAQAADPFIEVLDEKGRGPERIAYESIARIELTGKDAAAGPDQT